MDKDRVQGSVKQAKGAIKEAAGKFTGDAKLQADGKAAKTGAKFRMPSVALRMHYVASRQSHWGVG